MSAPSAGASTHQLVNQVERSHAPRSSLGRASQYFKSLFPFLTWIRRYNSAWLGSDLIAGITVGAIVVPQGMAYASLAKLDPEFGLYSSFVGVMIYWLFGTSKDISIGPVAVLSTVVGNLVHDVNTSAPDVAPYAVAASLSILTGFLVLLMGLLRCGFIVNLVSAPSLAAFMTGSAITIIVSQIPSVLGLTGFSTREAPFKVIMNTITSIDQANVNAVLGFSALILLYLARSGFTLAAERSPKHRAALQLLNSMRAVSVIVFFTLVSWFAHWSTALEPTFDVLGTIPKGFQHFGFPPVNTDLFITIIPYLPATIVVMLVEHMAIAKSFGRANNYSINPSQEMVAIGMTNLVGPFFGGYPSTGSFSRTAIQSKSGARSPLAGMMTGLMVLLALYLLTAAFFYIPTAVLAAVVIHAVGDLITPASTLRQYWAVSAVELLVFSVGVLASFMKSIETGLYASVALSTVALLYQSLRIRARDAQIRLPLQLRRCVRNMRPSRVPSRQYGTFEGPQEAGSQDYRLNLVDKAARLPHPGVVVYQLPTSLDYINSARSLHELTSFVLKHTLSPAEIPSDLQKEQSWSPPEFETEASRDNLTLSPLQAIVLDFSMTQSVDATAVQQLVDLKKQLDAYASPTVLEWRFVHIDSRQVRKSLQGVSLVRSVDPDQTPINERGDLETQLTCTLLTGTASGEEPQGEQWQP
ncbi:hypothetical protein NLU13_2003 [Sarocladium strictum]|uniref:STAS domain-containing protein n=1 Tax=Sarocladium strictum TaxID=5046 RepID=A0AA39LCR7_SARSR|nr:hypothetical protein NLU13_2003 [Sarocladium strictum]